MKNLIKGLFATVIALTLTSASAQPGMGGGPGRNTPQINAAMAKLFGDNQAFSANIDMSIKMRNDTMSLPGKIAFDNLKSRFEMNLSDAKGGSFPPGMADQMKSMGMDRMVVISRPDQKSTYMVYPGLRAYAPMPEASTTSTNIDDFKVEITKLGEETVEGQACVKNKVVVTDEKGKPHESTVWNAKDMKNFPVKIQTVEQGSDVTLVFKNVKLAKPEASQFEPPAGYKKYDNFMTMMQTEVMQRMQQGGMGQ